MPSRMVSWPTSKPHSKSLLPKQFTMKEYILKGESAEVEKVLRENRIRVERGVITITPVQPGTVLDPDSIKTLVESHEALAKDCATMAADQIVLAGLIEEVVDIAVEYGIVITDDLSDRLAKYGITIPKSAETVPNTGESAEDTGENVPETVPNNPNSVEDDKTVDVEDMTEVNLDDVKDAPAADTKEAPAPTPKKTRTKKT